MVVYMEDYIGRDPGFLYETISESIERGNRIVINFKGIDNVSMEYLKESVGRVLEENGFDTLKNKLNGSKFNNSKFIITKDSLKYLNLNPDYLKKYGNYKIF